MNKTSFIDAKVFFLFSLTNKEKALKTLVLFQFAVVVVWLVYFPRPPQQTRNSSAVGRPGLLHGGLEETRAEPSGRA